MNREEYRERDKNRYYKVQFRKECGDETKAKSKKKWIQKAFTGD